MSATQAFRLDGKVALVTGGGSGIGYATALALAQSGCRRLYLTGRRQEVLTKAASELRRHTPDTDVVTVATDIATPAGRQALVQHFEAQEALDIVVNNAGLFAAHPVSETSDTIWQQHLDVNVTAPFALIRDLLPRLRRSAAASIINISSTLAVKPIPNAAAYNAAKAALVQLTRSLALELGPEGIRVNSIMPAIVETPMYRGRYASDAAYQEGLKMAAGLHPLGRIGQPQDIAHAVVYLASSAASWVTGVNLPVDGGMLCT